MRLDRFTSKFQIAISDAQSLALGRDHQYIEPVHLMVALLDQNGSPIRPLLTMLNVDVMQLRSKLGEMLDRLPKVSGIGGDVQLSSALGSLFNLCDKVAQKRQDAYISSEIYLLAALEDKGPLGTLLKEFGLTEKKSLMQLKKFVEARRSMTRMRKSCVKRWKNSPSISLNALSRANSIL